MKGSIKMLEIIENKIKEYKNSPLATSAEEKMRLKKCLSLVYNKPKNSYTRIMEKEKIHNLV